MIIYPSTPEQAAILAEFLYLHAGVERMNGMRLVGWTEQENEKPAKLLMVVGLASFIGKTCQIHVAMEKGFHFTPKVMLERVFQHVFDEFKVQKLLGIVNSKNEKAMRYDLHLGFIEEHRIRGMHDNGGDIVILSMVREQCRYLKQEKVVLQ